MEIMQGSYVQIGSPKLLNELFGLFKAKDFD